MSAPDWFALMGVILIAPHVPFRLAAVVSLACLAFACGLRVSI